MAQCHYAANFTDMCLCCCDCCCMMIHYYGFKRYTRLNFVQNNNNYFENNDVTFLYKTLIFRSTFKMVLCMKILN